MVIVQQDELSYYSTADIAQWWFYGASRSQLQPSGGVSAGGEASGAPNTAPVTPATPTPETVLVVHGEMFVLEEQHAHPAPFEPLGPEAGLVRLAGAGAQEHQ